MFLALLTAQVLAEEAPPPLIDLDGTFFVQLGLFLFTLVVLSKTLFQPYLKMRGDRDRGIAGARKEAGEMGDKARAIVEDYDKRFAEAKKRGNDERNKLRLEATAHEREVIGKARAEVQTALDGARAKIAADVASGKAALAAEAAPLAKKVAAKALGREVA